MDTTNIHFVVLAFFEKKMTDDSFWKRAYGGRNYTHPVVQVFARQRVTLLKRYIPFHSIRKILDVGCGSGYSTFALSEEVPYVIGLDRSYFMLRRHPFFPSKLVLGDARYLPFPTSSFDLVCAWEVLHHFQDAQPIVQEMARVTRKWVVLFEPCRYHPVQFALALLQKEHRPILNYSANYLRSLLEKSGLRPKAIKRVGWIFPNKTPRILLPVLQRLPVENFLGISYLCIGEKP